jgi:hypothetical protein
MLFSHDHPYMQLCLYLDILSYIYVHYFISHIAGSDMRGKHLQCDWC